LRIKSTPMLDYAICEIAGKQYKAVPNKPLEVTLRDGEGVLAKTLLIVEDGKVKLGKPYLKEQLRFKVVEQKLGRKIRVFKYHAKANYRKTRGFRSKLTRIVLDSVKS